ncbi:MAG: hypothetical protein OHK0045_00310 [Raineya sp.]
MDILDPTGANRELQSGVSSRNISGSMYLTDWRVGYIYYGSKKEEKKLRYNAYKDAIHVMDAQGQEVIIEKGQIESFSIVDGGKEYKFKWITGIPKVNFGYLQIVYDGKVKIYYRHSRKVRQNVSQTEGYAGNETDDQFVEDNAFVIELPNQTKHITDGRKKEILAVFSDRKKELEEYIKAQKLDTKKLKDLVEVVKKYESFLN